MPWKPVLFEKAHEVMTVGACTFVTTNTNSSGSTSIGIASRQVQLADRIRRYTENAEAL